MKKRTKKLLKKLLILGALAVPTLARAQLRSVQILGPDKDFGYLVGDMLKTEAVITVVAGTKLDRQSLPIPGPLNAAIELRHIDAEQVNHGEASQIRIHAEYQSFFAPERVSETELPGFTIRLTAGPTTITAKIPAFPFYVSPIRLTQQTAIDLTQIRPNHAVHPLQGQNLIWRLMASMIVALAAALCLANNLGWLPGWRGKHRPFAVALRSIGQLSRTDDAVAKCCQALHHAFDATAGHKLFAGDLPEFIRSNPRFAPVQAEIAAFFATSQTWFFARNSKLPQPPANLLKLARTLRRLERRR